MAQHNRHLGVAAVGAVKANFSACQCDARLSRQPLHHGVALMAGLVQNQKIIGVGSVFVVNSTAPSVLRALLAAGTPVFSTNLYQSRPKLFRPLIPRSARGIDGGPRRFTEVVLNSVRPERLGGSNRGNTSRELNVVQRRRVV